MSWLLQFVWKDAFKYKKRPFSRTAGVNTLWIKLHKKMAFVTGPKKRCCLRKSVMRKTPEDVQYPDLCFQIFLSTYELPKIFFFVILSNDAKVWRLSSQNMLTVGKTFFRHRYSCSATVWSEQRKNTTLYIYTTLNLAKQNKKCSLRARKLP